VAGLAHYHRTPVAIVHLGEQGAERKPSGIAGTVFPPKTLVGVLPLIGVVVIHPDDIEIPRMPAQLRLHGTG
jgi:hypothetical protein